MKWCHLKMVTPWEPPCLPLPLATPLHFEQYMEWFERTTGSSQNLEAFRQNQITRPLQPHLLPIVKFKTHSKS